MADTEPREVHWIESALEWLGTHPDRFWLLLAMLCVAVVSAFSAGLNSQLVDGTRYFWLDDDQMISMRYARNVAEGYGPVWNPGERVEGYTNLLWMLLMAAVHLLPISDAHTSLWMRVINCGLACVVLLLTRELLRRFMDRPGMAVPAVLALVGVSHELLFWSMHGFETTLLTVVFLATVVRILDESAEGRVRTLTYVLLGLLPLIRGDGHHLWLAAAIVAWGLAKNQAAVLGRLALAASFPAAHLVFRLLYYGDWVPSTYHVKVSGYGLDVRLERGLDYLVYFFLFYWLVTLLALLGALWTQDRRRAWIIAGFGASLAYVVWIGGDNFFGARFLAPQAPLLVVLAAAGARSLAGGRLIAEFSMLASTVGSYLAFAAFVAFFSLGYSLLTNRNGEPVESLVSAVAIRENAGEDARVAVHSAGIAPYFSRRYCIDMLGKTDRAVAVLPPGDLPMAHAKIDPEHSLRDMRADLVIMTWLPKGVGSCSDPARALVRRVAPSWVRETYLSPVFQEEFCHNVVELPGATPIYARRDSPEAGRIDSWRPPRTSGG